MKEFLRRIYKYWMKFVYALGWVNSRIILTLLYIFLVGTYSFFTSLIGLLRGSGGKQQTGWLSKRYEEPTKEVLKRQF